MIRVQGEVYATPEEALAAAEELEGQLEETPEYGPQRRQLQAHVRSLRSAARRAQERAAATEPQPRGRPKPSRRQLARRAWSSRRAPRAPRLRSGVSGRVLRQTGATAAAGSTTAFVLKLGGLFAALALVIVLLEGERPNGQSPAGGLLRLVTGAIGVWVGQVDPFKPESWRAALSGEDVVSVPADPWQRNLPPSTSPAAAPGQPTVVRV